MVFIVAIVALIALIVLLWLIDRSPVTRKLRARILENDRAYRDNLRPSNPWEPEHGDAWPVSETKRGRKKSA